jgi:hypothetical protein
MCPHVDTWTIRLMKGLLAHVAGVQVVGSVSLDVGF